MFRYCLFLFAIFASSLSFAFSYTLELTEDELQEKIEALMPMTKKKFFVTVMISDPNISLRENSQEIGIQSRIEVIAPGNIKGTGRGEIRGTLVYNAMEGTFYFSQPTVVNLVVDKVPEKLTPKIQSIAQLAAANVLSNRPVYTLKDENLKHTLAKSVLKSVEVKNGKLIVTLGAF